MDWKVKIALGVIWLISVVAAAGFAYKTTPTLVEQEVVLDEGIKQLTDRIRTERFESAIRPRSPSLDYLAGYLGVIAVKKVDNWFFVPDYRPRFQDVKITPLDDKIYEGIITQAASVSGDITSFASSLSIDEAAEATIETKISLDFENASEIPWAELRRMRMDPDAEYYFVDNVVLIESTFRKFRKTKSGSGLTGVGFAANGDVYTAAEGFSRDRKLVMRLFDLRQLGMSEGADKSTGIARMLSEDLQKDDNAARLQRLLRQNSPSIQLPQFDPESIRGADTISMRTQPRAGVGFIQELKQEKSNGCWATAAAMLASWRSKQETTVEQYLATLDPMWQRIYEGNRGLTYDRKGAFLQDAGLIYEPGQSFLPERLDQMLNEHGPLWMTVGLDTFSSHAVIVVGTSVDETGSYFVRFIDPKTGRQQRASYVDFMTMYEKFAFDMNEYYMESMLDGDVNYMQIIHYPS